MEKCEMYEGDRAFHKTGIFVCQIENCPYGNGGKWINSADDATRYTVCVTEGQVEEKGLIKKIGDIKAIPA